jgi:hypothetical protein
MFGFDRLLAEKILQVALDHFNLSLLPVPKIVDLIEFFHTNPHFEVTKESLEGLAQKEGITYAQIVAALKFACSIIAILDTTVCPIINDL